jgi:hypothetical protein
MLWFIVWDLLVQGSGGERGCCGTSAFGSGGSISGRWNRHEKNWTFSRKLPGKCPDEMKFKFFALVFLI